MDYCKINTKSPEREFQANKAQQLKTSILSHKRSLLIVLTVLFVLCLVLLTPTFTMDTVLKEEFEPFKGVSVKIKHSEDATDIKFKIESKNFSMRQHVKRDKDTRSALCKFFAIFTSKNE